MTNAALYLQLHFNIITSIGIELIVSNSAEAEDDDSEEIGSDDSARSVDTIIPSDEDDDEGLYSSGDRRVPISKGRPKVLRKKKGDKGNEQMDGSGSKGAKAGQQEKKRTKSKNERVSHPSCRILSLLIHQIQRS